ncbi:hypothetical protein LJR296_007887 [Cupriavidus necator]|uniref:hypothetical protein n=1 Tax=Cupriavidus necator TaxID=106590 RepID=UPI003ECEE2D4
MSEDKTVVKIKSEAEGELVIETAAGKEQTYYLNPIRTMHLDVERLQVARSASTYYPADGEGGGLPVPALRVHGTARLKDRFISVIDDPENRSRTLKIYFKALDAEGRKQREEWAKEQGQVADYTRAYLGFNRADWEIGNDAEWWVECEILPETLSAITSAVESGALKRMSVGLTLKRIYVDDRYAPPSITVGWYLRPDAMDNTLEMPGMALGGLTRLDMDLTVVDLKPPTVDESQPEPVEVSSPDPDPDPTQSASALYTLAGNIEKLRGTLKWVGGLISLCLIILAFK